MWDKTFDKQAAFDGMRERGISRIEMDFSGGHDEGGIDDIYAFDAQGERVELPERKWHIGTQYSQGMETKIAYKIGDWQASIPVDQVPADEKAIVDFLDNIENIVYSKYHTFAGEFYVNGTAVIDVEKNIATIKGSESVETWDDFEDEL